MPSECGGGLEGTQVRDCRHRLRLRSYDDGLWRRHSWAILRDGILETTAVRLKYFGLLFQGDFADEFRHTTQTPVDVLSRCGTSRANCYGCQAYFSSSVVP